MTEQELAEYVVSANQEMARLAEEVLATMRQVNSIGTDAALALLSHFSADGNEIFEFVERYPDIASSKKECDDIMKQRHVEEKVDVALRAYNLYKASKVESN